MDCVLCLHNKLSCRSVYDKVFSKIWGASGGWLHMLCPHGVIYCIKSLLRAGSPRDHVDALLSFKYQPTVAINDMPHMVGRHGNKRPQGNMFFPFEGRIAEPTEDNVERANAREVLVEFKWMNRNSEFHLEISDCDFSKSQTNDQHPVTGTKNKYYLYDTMHEGNTTQEKEALRRVGTVKNLRGSLNTHRAEQANRSLNCSNHFLDEMGSTNHVFLLRLLMHLKNEKINLQFLKSLLTEAKRGKAVIGVDKFGRAILTREHNNAEKHATFQAKESVRSKQAAPESASATASASEGMTSSKPAATTARSEEQTSQPDSLSDLLPDIDFKDVAPLKSSWNLPILDAIYDILSCHKSAGSAAVLTPSDAPFKLDIQDLSHLLPNREIVGQVLDAALLVLMASARQRDVNVFSLPETFFTQVQTDLTMEGCVPLQFRVVHFIVSLIHHPHHWTLLLVYLHKKAVFYLDPMFTIASKDRIKADIAIINRIIWYRVLLHDENEDPPGTLKGWNYVTSSMFRSAFGTDLPKQIRGLDCGVWCIMYAFYLTVEAPFDFNVHDMKQLRKWLLALLLICSNHEFVKEHINWIKAKIRNDQPWSLCFNKGERKRKADILREEPHKSPRPGNGNENNVVKADRVKIEDGNVDSDPVETQDIVDLIKYHAVVAKEWLTKKQENLEGKFYSPIALTRIRTDDDLRERLEKLSKKQPAT